MFERLTTRVKALPTPSLVLGILGWIAASVFLFCWLFDIGRGPLDADRVGTAGEWVSGLATAGALTVTLYLLFRERHERLAAERMAKYRAEMDKTFGSFTQEISMSTEAERLVPVTAVWKRLDKPVPGESDNSDAEGRWSIGFTLFNGLDRPLADLKVVLRLTADWSGEDFKDETKKFPPQVVLCEGEIVPPSQFYRFIMEEGSYYSLPVERVESAAFIQATWRIGEYTYDWSQFGANGKTYLMVRVPEKIKERERAFRESKKVRPQTPESSTIPAPSS